ncbi:MAG: restriction endonuclease subunit S [Treponema sp.]|nr:restriction endonuclease subunit S [Treponema sp.]
MILPDGWKEEQLGNLLDFKNGLNFSQNPNGKRLSFLGVGNFKNKKIIRDVSELDEICLTDFPDDDYLLKKDDLVFVRSNGSKELVGRCVIIGEDFDHATYSGFCIRGRLKSEATTAYYIENLIDAGFLRQKLKKDARGSNISNLNQEILGELLLPFPPLAEQKKIAEVLSAWGKAIELTEKLVAEKELAYSFYVKKLIEDVMGKKEQHLSQGIRIETLFDEVSEKNHSDSAVLTIVQGTGTVLRDDSGRDIIYDRESLGHYKFVRRGDFIIHLRTFEGGLEIANQDGIVSPAYIVLRPKMKCASVYLYELFHTDRFIKQIMAPAVEGVRDGRSVKYDVLKKQKIYLPSLSEQEKIASFLACAKKEITLLRSLATEYRKQKQWLMQKLLIGSIRVKI